MDMLEAKSITPEYGLPSCSVPFHNDDNSDQSGSSFCPALFRSSSKASAGSKPIPRSVVSKDGELRCEDEDDEKLDSSLVEAVDGDGDGAVCDMLLEVRGRAAI